MCGKISHIGASFEYYLFLLCSIIIPLTIDSFHIVTSLSNRSSIEKLIKSFLQMKGQIAY